MGRAIRPLALLLLLFIGSGCFSRTYIYSKPTGAAVTIDNSRSLGHTPIELDEQVWIWTKHNITVQADGYHPQTIQIRSTGLNIGYAVVCVCTLGLLAPLGLLSAYPKQYIVELTPEAPEAAQAALLARPDVTFR